MVMKRIKRIIYALVLSTLSAGAADQLPSSDPDGISVEHGYGRLC
jgi:hypothetical protein